MAQNRSITAVLTGMLVLGSLAACSPDEEGPAEEAGEAIDEAAEQAGQKLEEAKEETGEAIEQAGDEIEQGTQ